ncbi:MAG: transposase [Candidatus Polarisedimenticolaceae bacterium]|nr:transposase [Candidatus Polarisedimenticolaceae bacterium]
MTNYRRTRAPGATWFFTVNLASRHNNQLLLDQVDSLRDAFRYVKRRHPFDIKAVVILPDHLHTIWRLPAGDSNYSVRWGLIKGHFSRSIERGESLSASRLGRGERGLWQRRFWEHLIRDDEDFKQHVEYIHWNPVKHNWVKSAADWPYSSFHRYVEQGIYPQNWCGYDVEGVDGGE